MKSKEKCCGCGGCAAVCPRSCIQMQEDETGFVYPAVDQGKCIDCHLCQQNCPMQCSVPEVHWSRKAYAAYATDENQRFQGSSGGLFGIAAAEVIQSGGIVFGAAFDSCLRLTMTSAETAEGLKRLYKSKYLQSDCQSAYPRIQAELMEGRLVLVCATPCQIAAIKAYLRREYENLLTIDFFCHGVPSQSFFNQCRAWVEKKKAIKILDYSFRTKRLNGATPHYYTITYEKGGVRKEKTALYLFSPFYLAFQKYLSLRDSCYACPFASGNRCADITIGDFHSIEKYSSGINRFDGISAVVLNTEEGAAFFERVKKDLKYTAMDYDMLVKSGEFFPGPTRIPDERALFLSDLREKPLEYVLRKHILLKDRWIKAIYYSLPHAIRKILKSIMIRE